MNPPSETRQQAFERLRKEYRSKIFLADALEIFDNNPNWLPEELRAQLPPESTVSPRLEFIPASVEASDTTPAPDASASIPLDDLLYFLAHLSVSKKGVAAALRLVYLPQDQPAPGTHNRHRLARFLMLHAQLEQVLTEHQLPPILLAKLIQCGFANPYPIDKATSVDLKEEIQNEPFAYLLEVIATVFANTKLLERVLPLLNDAKAEALAQKPSRYKNFFIHKYNEIGHLAQPGAPQPDKWFEELETLCGFFPTPQERAIYTPAQEQPATQPVNPAPPNTTLLLALQTRLTHLCPVPVMQPQEPKAQPQTKDSRLENLETRLYPNGKPVTDTATPPPPQPSPPPAPKQAPAPAAEAEKPDFWKRVWNWLGKNWDKLLLGALIVGGLLWLIWKQYFSRKKETSAQSEQDQPAARKKRAGFGSGSFAVN